MVQFKGGVLRAGAGGLSEMFGFDTFGLIWKVCSETLLCSTMDAQVKNIFFFHCPTQLCLK